SVETLQNVWDGSFVMHPGGGISGTIDGGGSGTPALDFSAYTSPVTVRLASASLAGRAGTAPGVPNGFRNIAKIIGGQASDTLVGPGATTCGWGIDGNNGGHVGGVVFQSFENL